MIIRKLKIFFIFIIGLPFILLSPFFVRSAKKLDKKIKNNPNSVPGYVREYHHFSKMDDQAYDRLKGGDYIAAKAISKRLLVIAEEYSDDWNYGNAVHHANTILGLVSLKEGETDKAIEYFQASGKVKGSPQLDSFGPSTCLAFEMLLLDKDNEVIEYLDNVASFWDFGYKQLPEWKKNIRAGDIPDIWQRLKY